MKLLSAFVYDPERRWYCRVCYRVYRTIPSGVWYCSSPGCFNHGTARGKHVYQAEGSYSLPMAKFIGAKPDNDARKPIAAPGTAAGIFSSCPALWEYLTLTEWEGGGRRQTATISVFVEDGKVKASLNDRALQRGCYATGASLEDVLSSLEDAVSSDRADWRSWPRKK